MTFRSPVLRLALLTASTLLALSGCNCGRECTVATDCPNPGQVCDQGVCKAGPDGGQSCDPSCPTNQFCDTSSLTCKNCDGTFPSGSGVNRGCTTTTPICDTTANGGLGQCRSCAPTGTGGATDPGCGGQFPVCDPALNGGLGQCVTCTRRGGCGNGRVCDTSVTGGACKSCIPSTDGGVANGCTAAEPVCVVSGTSQSCKVCTATAGCTGGTLCDVTANTGKGQCDYCLPGGDGGVSRGCTAGAPICDPARDAGYGACIVCNAGAGCGSPQLCDVADNGGTGKCKYCYDGSGGTDPGCTSGAPVCNTAGDAGLGTCVGCLSSADCTISPNFTCDTVVNRCKLCVVGPPQQGCNSGQTCDPLANGGQGACLGCTIDQNCQLPDGGAGPTPYCLATPPPGTCVECVTSPNCTDPTRPVCNGGNVCGCTGNTDCGGAAGKPICDTAANSGNGVCVVCTSAQGCSGDAPFCSNDTQCICRDNSDCPVGKACVGSPASCQPVDLSGAQTGILQFLDAGAGPVGQILIDGAYITYFKPAIGTTNSDPPGFFMQAQSSGPGMYVAIDPVTIGADGGSLAVGDRVQLTVTNKYLIGSTTVPAANGIAGVSVLSMNHPVRNLDTDTPAGLVVDVSNAGDVVSNIPAYLSRVVRMAGFIDGGFVSSGTDHFQADFPTAGVPAVPVPRLRLPSNVLDALDIGQGCRVTLKVGPFWRFTTTAQPSAYSPGDVQVVSCSFAPSVLWAYALGDTSVEVTFDHNIDPASVDATDFTVPGLVVLTAISNGGKKVVLGTTPQTAATRYTVTATGLTGVSGTPISATANHADFTGYSPPPTGLVINEIDYDNPGTDNFEYIELYNSSANPVDLGGLDLVLVNGGDSSTIAHREYSRFHLIATVDDAGVPANVLPAGGYFVFGRGDGGTLNLLAPVPDSALRLSFPNSDTVQNGPADGVGLLHYASGQLLDSVVYEPVATTEQTTFTVATGVGDRTYNFAEGNAPTTAADITTDAGAIARQPNGMDTDNNNADFKFVIPYTPGSANP